MSSLSLSITAWSTPGSVRDKNDDHYLCGPFVEQNALCHLVLPLSSRSIAQHGFLCAVADGMGGYAGGNLASQTILETLAGFFYAQKRLAATPEEMKSELEIGIGHARHALTNHLQRDPQWSQAGTTLAGLAVLPDGTAMPFHIGDSRVLRASAGFVRALTIDHTPLADEIAAGRMGEEDAARSPMASQLTRSLGREYSGDVEWGEVLQIAPGDIFLLGTDGWHGLGRGLSNAAMREILRDFSGDDTALVRHLVERAVECDGGDNATLVLVRVIAAKENEPRKTLPQPLPEGGENISENLRRAGSTPSPPGEVGWGLDA